MKYVMAVTLVALVGCGGSQSRAPASGSDAVSTTRTTSAALTTSSTSDAPDLRAPDLRAPDKEAANAPIIGVTEKDRALGTRIRQHLQRALEDDVGWNRVRMEVQNGHVKLVGTLPTVADSIAVEKCVREVKGVTAVANEIKLPAGTEQ